MRYRLASLLCVLPCSSLLYSAEPKETGFTSISVDLLNEIKVVGKLGFPLGQAVEMEATVISGAESGMKSYGGLYLLKVMVIAGKSLENPVAMPFHGEFPANAFELHREKLAKHAHVISDELSKQLEKDYVGTKVKFLGYESGEFGGIPIDLPKNYPSSAGTAFGFQSKLVVLKKL